MSAHHPTPPPECWNRIGIAGAGSCPRLPEFIHCRNCPVYAAAGRKLLEREGPADYIEEWTRNLARRKEATDTATLSIMVFRFADEWLGLRAEYCEKVSPVRPIHRLPHRTNAILTGMANIDGELLLCGSLGGLLKVEETAPPPAGGDGAARRMLVIGPVADRWVLPVDEVAGIQRVDPGRITAPPVSVAKAAHPLVTGMFDVGGRPTALLDAERLAAALKRSLSL
jgi:chemotaxis-related protein WspD